MGGDPDFDSVHVLRGCEWKLHFRKPAMFPGSNGTYSLFNIIDDPFESNDLSKIELKVLMT